MVTLLSPLDDLRDVLQESPVCGIDPSTKRLAVTMLLATGVEEPPVEMAGVICGPGFRTVIIELPEARTDDFRWYLEVEDAAIAGFTEIFERYGIPVWTVLEQPYSRPLPGQQNVKPQSFYVVGVVQVALARVLRENGIVEQMGPSEWKAPSLGKGLGNAKKARIMFWATQDMGLPLECKKCGIGSPETKADCDRRELEHDAADSLAMAVAAGRRWARWKPEHATLESLPQVETPF